MAPGLKLTKARHRSIVDSVRKGASRTTSAKAAGIGKTTLHRWLKAGETKDGAATFKRFAEDLRQAEAERELEAIEHIHIAASKDWRAEGFWLTHGPSRENWTKVAKHEVSGPGGEPMKTELDISDPKVREALRGLVDSVADSREG